MVAAVAFAIVEHATELKSEDRLLDDLDTHYEAKLRAQVMTQLESQEAGPMQRNDETGDSIATGADAKLAAEIEKRRKANQEEGSVQ